MKNKVKKEMEWIDRFHKGYCTFSDDGIYVSFTKYNDLDLDDFISELISKAKAEAYEEALNDYKTKTWPDINQKLSRSN